MRISFYGSSLVSAYWNGAATYYRGIIKALARRGHEVTFYEPEIYDRHLHRDIPDPEWAKVVIYEGHSEAALLRALEDGRDADVVVKASGVGAFDDLLEKCVIQMRKPGHTVIFWDVDAPATLDRVMNDPSDPFAFLIPQYDLILTYGGGPPVVGAYESLGARRCVPIYNALDPETHFPAEPDERFVADLGFLGNRLPDREARVDEFFVLPAARSPQRRFLLGGNGWQDKQLPSNVRYAGHVYTAEHNSFNCTPLAVLNIARDSMARYGFSPATRVFEAAGAGACIITDEWEGIETFLEPGSEILVAQDGHEVEAHLAELTPERSAAIGKAALARVLSEHTYAHRALEFEALFEACASPAGAARI